MGDYDFTYQLPGNFTKRVVQFLQQYGKTTLAEAFQRCEFEYENVGLAYYAGLRGDNWNKHAIDVTFEGKKDDVLLLQSSKDILKDVIEKALKPSESGLLVRNVFYLESDYALEETLTSISNESRLNVDIDTANSVLADLIKIGERICLNSLFDASSHENSINDYFRDMLIFKGYDEVKDQTRHGISSSGKNAGEVDLLLTKNGKEIAIYEGLKLEGVKSAYIDEHIKKAIINYNALGTSTFIVAYVNSSNFESFWNRYFDYLEDYQFPLQVREEVCQMAYPNAATRIARLILTRDGYDFPVYFIAVKIS